MADATLTLRQLNRATLARQLLLERADLPIADAVARIGGMQMQEEPTAHVGLWSRLSGISREAVAAAFVDRTLVRGTAMRGTLYAFTAEDFGWVRPTIGPSLSAGALKYVKKTATPGDVSTAIDHLTGRLAAAPMTAEEMRGEVEALLPGSDVRTVAYAARMAMPLIQVPTGTSRGFASKTPFALAAPWIGRPLTAEPDVPTLVRRYLAAHGPATAADIGAWTGLPSPTSILRSMPDLATYRLDVGAHGRAPASRVATSPLLYDVPDGLLPDPETPAPPRLLPAFDNLLLSHKDRTRVVTDDHRARLYQKGNLRILASVLVDGQAVGTWRLETKRKAATLTIQPFVPIEEPDRRALTAEAEALARFLGPTATSWSVTIDDP